MIGVKRLTSKRLLVVFIAVLAGAVSGCSSSDEGDAAGGAPDASSSSGSAPPPPPPPSQPPRGPEIAAAHILIQYEGAERAPLTVTRTKEEAQQVAQSIAEQAQAPGADFAALAREHSDGPSAPDGGDLGIFLAAQMIPEFSAAVMGMEVGSISDPVETQFGYHVILRNPVLKASARHILVMYAGSQRAAPTITRTKEEALTRAQEALARVRAGDDFATLAREYSDGPSASSGGDLGEFNKGVMTKAFDDATFACKVGEVTDIVETPFGYHIIKRYK